jgi:hypothetical protein
MPDISIEIDGRAFSGSFNVSGRTISVSSGLGIKTAVLGEAPAEQRAELLLRELVRDRKADGSLQTLRD